MRTEPLSVTPGAGSNHLLLVADGGRLEKLVRGRYPELRVICTDTCLSGIAALSNVHARAVVAFVDPANPHFGQAVAGLREAAGQDARVLLCCEPEGEPLAREAVGFGADDYLIYPIEPAELDQALGYNPEGRLVAQMACASPAATMAELQALGEIIASLDSEPIAVLQKIADWIRLASDAASVSLVVQGTAVQSGTFDGDPVLVEAIRAEGGELLGHISLGTRDDRPYGSQDTVKLRQCGVVAASLIQAAWRQRQWRELALTDELSGLPNRRYLLQFLDQVLPRATQERFRVTLLLFDIDDFKTYNDRCGHDAGDGIIRFVGQLFRKHCREHDVVTRYGGDEFAVVFWDSEGPRQPESAHPQSAFHVLDRFIEDLGSTELDKLRSLPNAQVTISGGLATFPWDATTRDELIHRADLALIQAKQTGKNRVLTIGQITVDPSTL